MLQFELQTLNCLIIGYCWYSGVRYSNFHCILIILILVHLIFSHLLLDHIHTDGFAGNRTGDFFDQASCSTFERRIPRNEPVLNIVACSGYVFFFSTVSHRRMPFQRSNPVAWPFWCHNTLTATACQLIYTTLYLYKHHLLPTGWCFAPKGEHSIMAGL